MHIETYNKSSEARGRIVTYGWRALMQVGQLALSRWQPHVGIKFLVERLGDPFERTRSDYTNRSSRQIVRDCILYRSRSVFCFFISVG